MIKLTGLSAATITVPFPLVTFAKHNDMADNKNFDVIIIGGSYSGLSAAMALGRSLRKVLVIDSGLPCNRQTPHSHNFITQDGEIPSAISEKAKSQVLTYDTVKFLNDLAVIGEQTDEGFNIITEKGKYFAAKKLIFAAGIKDIMPDIKGFAECWGISVIHCPYCHGYEVRNEKTGILANGDFAYHYAQLVNNLTKDLTIFTNGKSTLTQEQNEKLEKYNINVIEKEVSYLEHTKGKIQKIVFKDSSSYAVKALYSKPDFEQHCKIPEKLGCELTEQGFIKTDMFQKTNVEGIFACGDSTSMMRSVANAVATGNLTGAMVNNQLVEEKF